MASLNHIGIAINNLPLMTKLFGLLNLKIDHSEAVPTESVMTHFLPLPLHGLENSFNLEFLEPLDPEKGPIANFLKKKGPGIHHLAFSVNPGELELLSERLRKEGFRLIYDKAQPGAHGAKVNFIHPAFAGGILIELMEPR
ncbi:MAG: VOC family protein [Bdellovibrionia bacterium]